MAGLVNVNRSNPDVFYRYKMPKLIAKVSLCHHYHKDVRETDLCATSLLSAEYLLWPYYNAETVLNMTESIAGRPWQIITGHFSFKNYKFEHVDIVLDRKSVV